MIVPALAITTAAGAAKGGNSANAKNCQGKGWTQLVTSAGGNFKNQGDCVSYGAKGGTYGSDCLDNAAVPLAHDLRLVGPTNTFHNSIAYQTVDGSCSGGTFGLGTGVTAPDFTAADALCNQLTGSGALSVALQPFGYGNAPSDLWGCLSVDV